MMNPTSSEKNERRFVQTTLVLCAWREILEGMQSPYLWDSNHLAACCLAKCYLAKIDLGHFFLPLVNVGDNSRAHRKFSLIALVGTVLAGNLISIINAQCTQ